MYPYKEEIISSVRAFFLAWLILLTPIFAVAQVLHMTNPTVEIDN